MGVQGRPIDSQQHDPSTASCWWKPMSDGSTAVILLNVGAEGADISCSLKELHAPGDLPLAVGTVMRVQILVAENIG